MENLQTISDRINEIINFAKANDNEISLFVVQDIIKNKKTGVDEDLLNKAVEIKGRLYAKRNGYYYAFQNERDIDYHGYRADDLGDDIKCQLDREFA